MKSTTIISFILTSVAAGLAAAFLFLIFYPNWIQNGEDSTAEPPSSLMVPSLPVAESIPARGPVSYAAAVRRAAPSVVNIYTAKVVAERSLPFFDDPSFRRFFGDPFTFRPRQRLESSLGSGVIIDSKGFILTNNHVVAGADEIRLVLADGRNIPAIVVGADPDTDLALLHAHGSELPAVVPGDSSRLLVGDVVLAIGNPFGVGQTVTMGIVSATGRTQLGINTFENFIQTDAAINPGNSGGALINARGELVGISTAIFSQSGGSQGIGFAIPVSLTKEVVQQLLVHGRVVRGWLGVVTQDITPELAESFGLKQIRGVLISGILERGPADRAGLEPGDIVTHVGKRAVNSANEALNRIAMQPPGSVILVTGWRGSRQFEFKVEVAERPPRPGL